MSPEWFWRQGGQVYGPATFAQLASMVQGRQLTGNTEVRQGPDGPWMYAGQVKGLFGGPAAAAPPAPPANVMLAGTPAPFREPMEVFLDPLPAAGGLNLPLSLIITDSFLAGIFAALGGFILLVYSVVYGWLFLAGALLLAVAVCCFLLCFGLASQQKWAFPLLVVTYSMHIVVGAIQLIILIAYLSDISLMRLSPVGMFLGILLSMAVAATIIAMALGPLRSMVDRRG